MNKIAQRSHEIDSKLKNKLIEHSLFVQKNAHDFLDLYDIPQNGAGKIYPLIKNIKEKENPKKIIFLSIDSVQAANESIDKIGILISCSHRRAGGGWLSGSIAQEESVSRASTWGYQAGLPEFNVWYNQDKKIHWLGQRGSLIIDGLLLYDHNLKELNNPKQVVFGGVAAANKAALGNDTYWESLKGTEQRKQHLTENIVSAIFAFHSKGVKNVILCAFGTNVFGWDFLESIEVLYTVSKQVPNSLNLICAVCNEKKQKEAEEIYRLLIE